MTGSVARAVATYQEVQVTSRSPLELVVMLYDGAIGALRLAREAMERRDLIGKRDGMKKALEIVQHLQSSLNMEEGGPVAEQLDALYGHVIERVLDANVQGDPSSLDEAITLLVPVRDAWATIAATPADTAPLAR
jgi:flagellar protein FliS